MNLRKYALFVFIGILLLLSSTVLWTQAQETTAGKNIVPGIHSFKIEVKGIGRSYLVYIPKTYNRADRLPVVIMFHGGGGTARAAMRETKWNEKAETENFLAVFPEGMAPDASRPASFRDNPQTWNDGSKRITVGAAKREVPDIEFVYAMLAELKLKFSVDEDRIYVTGFSNGASMAFRVARELSEQIAAVATVAGIDWLDKNIPKIVVPLLYITGTADPLNPLMGGKIYIGQKSFGTKPAIPDMVAKWVKMHSCSEKGRVIYNKNKAKGIAYGPTGKPPKIVFYTIEGHGHHWPGGKSALPAQWAGQNITTFKATDIIWDFFKAHALAYNKRVQKTFQLTRASGTFKFFY